MTTFNFKKQEENKENKERLTKEDYLSRDVYRIKSIIRSFLNNEFASYKEIDNNTYITGEVTLKNKKVIYLTFPKPKDKDLVKDIQDLAEDLA